MEADKLKEVMKEVILLLAQRQQISADILTVAMDLRFKELDAAASQAAGEQVDLEAITLKREELADLREDFKNNERAIDRCRNEL